MTEFSIDRGVVQDLDDIKNFPLADNDLLVVGFPKSGTSWLQVMVTRLWDSWNTCGGDLRKVPSLHGRHTKPGHYYGFADCVSLASPRLMKTHLPLALMPAAWPEHGKVIHITRNPKDVAVSLFHELRHMKRTNPDADQFVEQFGELLDRFNSGNVPWGPFADNVLSWHAIEHPNLLKITYEETKRDTRKVLEKIIDFVGLPISPDRLDRVIAETEFTAMSKSDVRFQINHPDLRDDTTTPFMRKGKIGDWKSAFTVERNIEFDEKIVRPLEEAGLHLTYE
jgi:sulfotransferase